MKTLLVLRHAKSSWDNANLTDFQRPLNARGKQDAPRMGRLLVQEDLVPDLVVTSSAVRARRTAEAVAQACGYEGQLLATDELYHAGPEEFVEVLNQVRDDPDVVLVIGHNPGLEDFVEALTDEWIRMPTAALVRIDLPIGNWGELDSDVVGKIAGEWRPKELS